MSYRVRPGNVSKFSSKTWNCVRAFSRLWFVMYFRSQQKTNHLNYYRKAEWTLFRALKMCVFFPHSWEKRKSLTLAERAGWQTGKFTSQLARGVAPSQTKSCTRDRNLIGMRQKHCTGQCQCKVLRANCMCHRRIHTYSLGGMSRENANKGCLTSCRQSGAIEKAQMKTKQRLISGT